MTSTSSVETSPRQLTCDTAGPTAYMLASADETRIINQTGRQHPPTYPPPFPSHQVPTHISTGLSVRPMTPSTASRSRMSTSSVTTLPSNPPAACSSRQWSATCSRAARRRASRTTLAPARANSVAVAAPMPDDAPVTSAREVSASCRQVAAVPVLPIRLESALKWAAGMARVGMHSPVGAEDAPVHRAHLECGPAADGRDNCAQG
jgi:hypothetical protein